MKTVSYFLVE